MIIIIIIMASWYLYIIDEQHMTINLHSLLHLSDNVRELGPLWSHSCFPFENMIGIMKTLYHGSQQIDKQVNYKL